MAERSVGNAPKLIGYPVAAGVTAATDILADSGAVPYGGAYVCNVILGATTSTGWVVARRNAANSADISGFVFTILTGANASSEFVFAMKLETGERVVVRPLADNAGNHYIAFNLEQYD